MPQIPSHESVVETVWRILKTDAGHDDTRTKWTRYIGRRLAKAAQAAGCRVYDKQFAEAGRGEYLLDQVWAIEGHAGSWASYRGLALAMECEWDSNEDSFLADYCKLLEVAAHRRVFIGNLGTRSLWPDRGRLLTLCHRLARQHVHFRTEDAIAVFLCERGGCEHAECWLITGGAASPKRIRGGECIKLTVVK